VKPKRIILVRHGESTGNADRSIYKDVPDYALRLTALGRQQAHNKGQELRTLLYDTDIYDTAVRSDTNIMFYVSPYWRTRDTFAEIGKWFPRKQWREDPRIREQSWGHLREEAVTKLIEKERDAYGSYYFKFQDGEAGTGVEDRISDFLDTMYRDFAKHDFPETVIIITHGFTMRIFLKRWFHWTTKQFEQLANPHNCESFMMELHECQAYTFGTGCKDYPCPNNGKYVLVSNPLRYDKVNHPWQYEPLDALWGEHPPAGVL